MGRGRKQGGRTAEGGVVAAGQDDREQDGEVAEQVATPLADVVAVQSGRPLAVKVTSWPATGAWPGSRASVADGLSITARTTGWPSRTSGVAVSDVTERGGGGGGGGGARTV